MKNFFSSISDILHGIEAYHDSHTMQHECRTGKLMRILSKTIGLDETHANSLGEIGGIHDIGKIALPSYILEKPGPLNTFERQTVELHPQIGYELVKKIKHPLAELAATVTLNHHEAYDGSGYPNGLKEKNIPLEGRICRICDVYDALREYRPYRPMQTPELADEYAIKLMTEKNDNGMANTFDPELLEIFLNIDRNVYEPFYTSTTS